MRLNQNQVLKKNQVPVEIFLQKNNVKRSKKEKKRVTKPKSIKMHVE